MLIPNIILFKLVCLYFCHIPPNATVLCWSTELYIHWINTLAPKWFLLCKFCPMTPDLHSTLVKKILNSCCSSHVLLQWLSWSKCIFPVPAVVLEDISSLYEAWASNNCYPLVSFMVLRINVFEENPCIHDLQLCAYSCSIWHISITLSTSVQARSCVF